MTSPPGPEPLSPSDLVALGHSPEASSGSVRVAGRVVHSVSVGCVLADAIATVPVRFRADTEVTPGELIVVEGRFVQGELHQAHLVERHAGQAPTAVSEFGRFALGGVGRHLVARGAALRIVRDYFAAQGFVEVDTPFRVPSPGLDAYVDAMKADDGWLITSPELHMKRLVVGGLHRVYQIAHTTRAGEEGRLHEPEFTMLEWYRAFSGMDAVIADTEALISNVVRSLAGTPVVTFADGRRVDVTPPFRRVTVRDAFREHAGVDDAAALALSDENRYFELLVDKVEPALARLSEPVILSEFPISQAALARPCSHDTTVSERFEVYLGGVELCNGFGELTNPHEQRARFEREHERRRRSGAPLHPIDEKFLAALAEGLPPSGGNALGLDRLIMLAVGADGIADVMGFPRALA